MPLIVLTSKVFSRKVPKKVTCTFSWFRISGFAIFTTVEFWRESQNMIRSPVNENQSCSRNFGLIHSALPVPITKITCKTFSKITFNVTHVPNNLRNFFLNLHLMSLTFLSRKQLAKQFPKLHFRSLITFLSQKQLAKLFSKIIF